MRIRKSTCLRVAALLARFTITVILTFWFADIGWRAYDAVFDPDVEFQPFESTRWKASWTESPWLCQAPDKVRISMVADLCLNAKAMLLGKTKSEVLDILGPPTEFCPAHRKYTSEFRRDTYSYQVWYSKLGGSGITLKFEKNKVCHIYRSEMKSSACFGSLMPATAWRLFDTLSISAFIAWRSTNIIERALVRRLKRRQHAKKCKHPDLHST